MLNACLNMNILIVGLKWELFDRGQVSGGNLFLTLPSMHWFLWFDNRRLRVVLRLQQRNRNTRKSAKKRCQRQWRFSARYTAIYVTFQWRSSCIWCNFSFSCRQLTPFNYAWKNDVFFLFQVARNLHFYETLLVFSIVKLYWIIGVITLNYLPVLLETQCCVEAWCVLKRIGIFWVG